MWDLELLRSVGLGPGVDTSNPESSMNLLTINPFRSPIRIQTEGTRWPQFSNAFIFSAQSIPTAADGLASQLSSVHL